MNIEVYIEEIVLRGLEVRNRGQIAVAVQRELARLLKERGLPTPHTESAAIQHVRAPGFQLSQNGGDERLAGQVAQATYGALIR